MRERERERGREGETDAWMLGSDDISESNAR